MVRYLASATAIAIGTLACPAAHAACDDLVPPESFKMGRRGITPADLVRLRDIGYPEVIGAPTSPYALSPDGQRLAFVIARSDPQTNARCSALVLMPVFGKAVPRVLDLGGGPPLMRAPVRGVFMTSGFPEEITPIWSPDGQYLAYRKLVKGIVQLSVVKVSVGHSALVTSSAVDVEDFAWARDSRHLIYLARAGRPEAERQIAEQGRTGWRYDETVLPMESWSPQPRADTLPQQAFSVELWTGVTSEASVQEREMVVSSSFSGARYDIAAVTSGGAKAWAAPLSGAPSADRQLWAQFPGSEKIACRQAACRGSITRVYWDRSSRSVVFQQRGGWNNEETGIYRWFPASGRVVTLLRTMDALTGCIRAAKQLICGRENASKPRRIVAIDLASGKDREIFNPNPEFSFLKLGKVQRLRWKNDLGLPAWGDIVLPPDYDGKTKLPLVVVQYSSRGFLRGGTGDDYPIFAMAARGMAVLGFQRPPPVSKLVPDLNSREQEATALQQGWAERRSIFSALSSGVDMAVATGAIDPKRIGISGLSDGSSTLVFALSNSDRFAAAATSTCCDDRVSSMVLAGLAFGDANRAEGYPRTIDDDEDFWKPMSISMNARRINTPLLMQQADREALMALPALVALREAGKPVEMFVYPDEYHDKWQPEHRLAVYERNIDWFDFWLRDHQDPAPGKQEQYQRWRGMRAAQPRHDAISP